MAQDNLVITNDLLDKLSRLTTLLGEAQETMEEIASGGAGVATDIRGGYGHSIGSLIEAVRDMAEFVEDELGCRLTRADDSQIEQMVDSWLDG